MFFFNIYLRSIENGRQLRGRWSSVLHLCTIINPLAFYVPCCLCLSQDCPLSLHDERGSCCLVLPRGAAGHSYWGNYLVISGLPSILTPSGGQEVCVCGHVCVRAGWGVHSSKRMVIGFEKGWGECERRGGRDRWVRDVPTARDRDTDRHSH